MINEEKRLEMWEMMEGIDCNGASVYSKEDFNDILNALNIEIRQGKHENFDINDPGIEELREEAKDSDYIYIGAENKLISICETEYRILKTRMYLNRKK